MSMLSRNKSNVSKSAEIVDLNTNREIHYPGLNDFSFAFFIADSRGLFYDINSSYFTISMYQANINVSDPFTGYNVTQLSYQNCTADDLSSSNDDVSQNIVSNTMFCPVNKDYALSGNFGSEQLKYLYFEVNRCNSATSTVSCASDSDTDTYIKNLRITILIANSYVDFDDYDNPVKRYFDDRYSYRLTSGFRKISRAYIRPNKAEFRDSLVDLEFSEKKEFYSVESTIDDFSAEFDNGNLFTYQMLLDHNRDNYERSVYTLTDMFGQVGGVFELFKAIGSVLIGFISSKILVLTMMGSMYHVQVPEKDEDKNFSNFNRPAQTITRSFTKIEPKSTLNRLSKISEGSQVDESKSEVSEDFWNNNSIPDIVKSNNRKSSAALNKFLRMNTIKNQEEDNFEDNSSIDLVDKLRTDINYRRKYNF